MKEGAREANHEKNAVKIVKIIFQTARQAPAISTFIYSLLDRSWWFPENYGFIIKLVIFLNTCSIQALKFLI